MKNNISHSENEILALDCLSQFLSKGYICSIIPPYFEIHVSKDSCYCFIEDHPDVPQNHPVSLIEKKSLDTLGPLEIVEHTLKYACDLFVKIEKSNFIPTYSDIRRIPIALSHLNTFSFNSALFEDQNLWLCFWLNISNLMYLHSLLIFGYDSSEETLNRLLYRIPPFEFSREQILSGVLGMGRKESSFDSNDLRKLFFLSFPSSIFAISNGTPVSPPIFPFTPENIEEMLKILNHFFLTNFVRINVETNEISIPQLIKEYIKNGSYKTPKAFFSSIAHSLLNTSEMLSGGNLSVDYYSSESSKFQLLLLPRCPRNDYFSPIKISSISNLENVKLSLNSMYSIGCKDQRFRIPDLAVNSVPPPNISFHTNYLKDPFLISQISLYYALRLLQNPESHLYKGYVAIQETLALLVSISKESIFLLSPDLRRAFWINIYNAVMIFGIIAHTYQDPILEQSLFLIVAHIPISLFDIRYKILIEHGLGTVEHHNRHQLLTKKHIFYCGGSPYLAFLLFQPTDFYLTKMPFQAPIMIHDEQSIRIIPNILAPYVKPLIQVLINPKAVVLLLPPQLSDFFAVNKFHTIGETDSVFIDFFGFKANVAQPNLPVKFSRTTNAPYRGMISKFEFILPSLFFNKPEFPLKTIQDQPSSYLLSKYSNIGDIAIPVYFSSQLKIKSQGDSPKCSNRLLNPDRESLSNSDSSQSLPSFEELTLKHPQAKLLQLTANQIKNYKAKIIKFNSSSSVGKFETNSDDDEEMITNSSEVLFSVSSTPSVSLTGNEKSKNNPPSNSNTDSEIVIPNQSDSDSENDLDDDEIHERNLIAALAPETSIDSRLIQNDTTTIDPCYSVGIINLYDSTENVSLLAKSTSFLKGSRTSFRKMSISSLKQFSSSITRSKSTIHMIKSTIIPVFNKQKYPSSPELALDRTISPFDDNESKSSSPSKVQDPDSTQIDENLSETLSTSSFQDDLLNSISACTPKVTLPSNSSPSRSALELKRINSNYSITQLSESPKLAHIDSSMMISETTVAIVPPSGPTGSLIDPSTNTMPTTQSLTNVKSSLINRPTHRKVQKLQGRISSPKSSLTNTMKLNLRKKTQLDDMSGLLKSSSFASLRDTFQNFQAPYYPPSPLSSIKPEKSVSISPLPLSTIRGIDMASGFQTERKTSRRPSIAPKVFQKFRTRHRKSISFDSSNLMSHLLNQPGISRRRPRSVEGNTATLDLKGTAFSEQGHESTLQDTSTLKKNPTINPSQISRSSFVNSKFIPHFSIPFALPVYSVVPSITLQSQLNSMFLQNSKLVKSEDKMYSLKFNSLTQLKHQIFPETNSFHPWSNRVHPPPPSESPNLNLDQLIPAVNSSIRFHHPLSIVVFLTYRDPITKKQEIASFSKNILPSIGIPIANPFLVKSGEFDSILASFLKYSLGMLHPSEYSETFNTERHINFMSFLESIKDPLDGIKEATDKRFVLLSIIQAYNHLASKFHVDHIGHPYSAELLLKPKNHEKIISKGIHNSIPELSRVLILHHEFSSKPLLHFGNSILKWKPLISTLRYFFQKMDFYHQSKSSIGYSSRESAKNKSLFQKMKKGLVRNHLFQNVSSTTSFGSLASQDFAINSDGSQPTTESNNYEKELSEQIKELDFHSKNPLVGNMLKYFQPNTSIAESCKKAPGFYFGLLTYSSSLSGLKIYCPSTTPWDIPLVPFFKSFSQSQWTALKYYFSDQLQSNFIDDLVISDSPSPKSRNWLQSGYPNDVQMKKNIISSLKLLQPHVGSDNWKPSTSFFSFEIIHLDEQSNVQIILFLENLYDITKCKFSWKRNHFASSIHSFTTAMIGFHNPLFYRLFNEFIHEHRTEMLLKLIKVFAWPSRVIGIFSSPSSLHRKRLEKSLALSEHFRHKFLDHILSNQGRRCWSQYQHWLPLLKQLEQSPYQHIS